MTWGAVQLKPGVDTQMTLSANSAGVSQSQLIRYKEQLIQTIGGWANYVPVTIGTTVRDLHPWQDINGVKHLGVAATGSLGVITAGAYTDITPQVSTTNPVPNFSITTGSSLVTVVDVGSSASTFNTVYFNTPIAIGAYLLNGPYPIRTVLGSSAYTIQLPSVSTATVTSSGKLPIFSTSLGTASVTVTLSNNAFTATPGLFQQFIAPTTVGVSSVALTIQGKYQIATVIDSTNFTINVVSAASTAATATMNGGLAQLKYYITLGPATVGTGFGFGGFGSGGFGTGTSISGVAGMPITATDWTTDNWGEIYIACPANGPIYIWSANFGYQNAAIVNTAPFFNGGIFISMPQQILVSYRSTQSSGVQDPLRVRWSNAGDYTNWTVSNQTTAGSFQLTSGSLIMGGIQAPQFALISTDIDVWTMTYVGGTVIFNFTRVGNGCGWVGSHACGILSGSPYWMSGSNFFTLGNNGVVPLPCTVWDQVFQNLSTANQWKARCAVNSAFNEVAWFYPSANATENDSYVKVHIQGNEFEWDYGSLTRTAWCDVSILGMPLGVDTSAQIYQHETGTAITGISLPSFRTGWWVVGEGQDIPYVDMIIPDFIYGLRSGAQNASLLITFYGVDYPGDTPTVYGPYSVTSATAFINTRIRNRLLSAVIQSDASSEFWRIGRIRFRFAQSGRR